MNKSAIERYATWARRKLIDEIKGRLMMLGITPEEIKKPTAASTSDIEFYDIGMAEPYRVEGVAIRQRGALVRRIENLKKTMNQKAALDAIVEETAYTWFNRLIALRFMEVNDYLPMGERVLSSGSAAKVEPEIVTRPFASEMTFTDDERARIIELQDKNKMDELFRMLLIKTCNEMNEYLPEIFERTDDYTEILLSLTVSDTDGVVQRLVRDIPEEDFDVSRGGQVEIIGWLYQYYNSEPKAAVDKKVKNSGKVSKEELPAKTQLFTPDWIVRYMVENSLGRLWLDGHAGDDIRESWRYYIDSAEGNPPIERDDVKLEDIRFLDPCMGSGHILAYAFDVFLALYVRAGYTARDAADAILEHNLYGLDIDDRAAQLAYFSVMMKAREHDRQLFKKHIRPHVYAIQETNDIKLWREVKGDGAMQMKLTDTRLEHLDVLIETFRDAKEYGSLIDVTPQDYDELTALMDSLTKSDAAQSLMMASWLPEVEAILPQLIAQAKVMSAKYDVVVTNPPYLGSAMNAKLSKFLKDNYPASKSDLFAAFIEKCIAMTKENEYTAMITMHSWMFLSSFEKLRKKIEKKTIVNMAHLGARAFEDISGEVVQSTAFVLQNKENREYKGVYVRLVDGNSQDAKEKMFLSGDNRYVANQNGFEAIPGEPIAYWIKANKVYRRSIIFEKCAVTRAGMITGNNDLFTRLWFEVCNKKFSSQCISRQDAIKSKAKWFPYSKGGSFRKWYGNDLHAVNWENDGYALQNTRDQYGHIPAHAFNFGYIFKSNICWNSLSSKAFSARSSQLGHLYDAAGSFAHIDNTNTEKYLLSFLNSKIAFYYLKALNPTMNFQKGDVSRLPVISDNQKQSIICDIAKQNIALSKSDWDERETSWDFERDPLLMLNDNGGGLLSEFYEAYKKATNERFDKLRANEEELNRIFIDIYGLEGELTPDVSTRDVTVARVYDTAADIDDETHGNGYVVTKERIAKNFISYGVGCLFGRYSLDETRLVFAGGEWDASRYHTFAPDADNIIPIYDTAYTDDDIVAKFADWLSAALGEANLEANLRFLAEAIDSGGASDARAVLRRYFIKDFYADHCKMYQKRPIYWLYDSGKKNGFKALMYMHRYDGTTTGRARMDYLRHVEEIYDKEIERYERDLRDAEMSAHDRKKTNDRLRALRAQLEECRAYDEEISAPATASIAIDLDDGVKVNYEKVQTVDGRTYRILARI